MLPIARQEDGAKRNGRAKHFAPRTLAALIAATFLCTVVLANDAGAPVRSLGVPLDSARFEIDGKTVLRGIFASDVRLDALSLGEVTYTREAGKLHEIAAVRVSTINADGTTRVFSDEELASGSASCRIIAGRDMTALPHSALDTLGGLSVATMLMNDGSANVRIDVYFPAGVLDDLPGTVDRKPEAILVGPPPTNAVRLGAIVAGDIDDPVIADGVIEVPPEALEAGRSGVAILFGDFAKPRTIAMVGYDLDELGVHDGPALGFRIEIPRGVIMGCKIFGGGESATDVLASASAGEPLLASFGEGWIGGGDFREPGHLAIPPFGRAFPISGAPFVGSDGGPNPPGGSIPIVPAPAALIVLALGLMAPRRRRRNT